jgi:ABC-type glycerol-3-phosphate transport system substrate-binding protein
MSNGTVVFAVQQGERIYLKSISIDRREWGERISLPSGVMRTRNVFQGTDEYLYLYSENSLLKGIIAETGEHENILNWAESSLTAVENIGIMFLTDGNISVTRRLPLTDVNADFKTELILLTKTSADELPDKIQLTFGTFNFSSNIRHAVEQFNIRSATHRIHVIDYSIFNTETDSSAGITRLTTEIITGNAPDILDAWSLPVHDYISHGLLVDLNPLLDADPELSRDSILEGIHKASEIDGSLYYIFPSFRINTLAGNPNVLGSYPGWNMSEFMTVLAENPQADIPLGEQTDRMSFLKIALRNDIDKYIDRATGIALFDNDDFIELLELASTFPSEVDTSDGVFESVISGRQIMQLDFSCMNNYWVWRSLFSGELIFKGFPDTNREGNTIEPTTFIAITSTCPDIDAAWEFVRIFLLENYQRDALPIRVGLPSNKVVFEERLGRLMNPNPAATFSATDGYTILRIEDAGLSQAEVDSIRALVNNKTRIRYPNDTLMAIIEETAADFFNGQMTAQDAALIIQSRTTTYLSERN